jgi:hypothetical protein
MEEGMILVELVNAIKQIFIFAIEVGVAMLVVAAMAAIMYAIGRLFYP